MSPTMTFALDCRDLNSNKKQKYKARDKGFRLYQKPDEPEGALRLEIHSGEMEAVLFPSKGLSLGQVTWKGRQLFWEAPYDLPDPKKLNLWSDEACINGKPMAGFTFLPTFCAGIELYGLKNWGMPCKDQITGELYPLHGETSNIPVNRADIEIDKKGITVISSFIYNDMKGNGSNLWYKEGNPLYRVKKYFRFETGMEPKVIIRDTIENISSFTLTPDWGYHITFRPDNETRLLVGSKHMEERFGGKITNDVETWTPQNKPASREETGIIHKELIDFSPEEKKWSFVLVKHPNGEGILYKFPKLPYFQTWSCRGGAGSNEFTLKSGKSLLERNWDGLGIEIGSSSLDHNGNTDKSVEYKSFVHAGRKKVIEMELLFPDKSTIKKLEDQINRYNKDRKRK